MAEDLLAKDYLPHSELIVEEHSVPRGKFPVIDGHNHLGLKGFGPGKRDAAQIVRDMDAVNFSTIVNLSGETGDVLKKTLDLLDNAFPGRFATYCNLDFNGFGSADWTKKAAAQLLKDVKAGAKGLKIYKRLGLHYRDQNDKLVMPDDARLDDVWDAAGQAGVPVTIHIADPTAFFKPLDRFNERWDELHGHPDWHFYGPQFPPFMTLIESMYRMIGKHPKTNFITAHVGCYPENLGYVSKMMDRYPNLYTDISARIAELGRAPYTSRKWFLKYPDRILFGTDFTPQIPMYQVHFRFLETADEYFAYEAGEHLPGQGRWRIYGVSLPDEVLQKVYNGNARRLLHL